VTTTKCYCRICGSRVTPWNATTNSWPYDWTNFRADENGKRDPRGIHCENCFRGYDD
jgi:hypothetical protein